MATNRIRTLARSRDLTLLDSDQREVIGTILQTPDTLDSDLAQDIITTLETLPTTYDTVFTKAAELVSQGQYQNTNLGRLIHVTHSGAEYTVIVPADFRAHIAYQRAWGGVEDLHINADTFQDRRLRK